MNNKHKKLLSLIAFAMSLIIGGCSYNGTIKDSVPMSSSMLGTPSAQGVTLIDNRDDIQNPVFKHGVATLSYDIKDSLMNVARNALKTSYSRVDISKTPIASNPVYAIPRFDVAAASGNDITTGLTSSARIDLYDTNSKQLITSVTANKNSQYTRPGSLDTLQTLTILTAFVATPFTMPAAVNIAGNTVSDLIKDNEKGLSSALGTELASRQNIATNKAASESCHVALAKDPSMRVLDGKVSLLGVKDQTFDMLASTKKPNAEEKEALRIWGASLDRCEAEDARMFRSMHAPKEIVSLFDSVKTEKSNLVISLYNGEITYGEFARKRRENSSAFDAALAKTLSDLERQARDSADRRRLLAFEEERTSIARAQANAAESMAFQSMISNIQQANSNMIQQQAINRPNTQPVYRAPVHTTCTPGFGSVNCTTY
jgi:hypothetical protein